jgi:UDP-N-acetylmuramoyl-tripeptide--D-alanyl-D-alanine ligase
MPNPLKTIFQYLLNACPGSYIKQTYEMDSYQEFPYTGVSIDTRRIQNGNIFIPFYGTHEDGHDFISKAFQLGAAAACVSETWAMNHDLPGLYIVFPFYDPLKILQTCASFVRKAFKGTVFAITGSVGKTTSKTWLGQLLQKQFSTFYSPESYNNAIGVSWTLANIPEETRMLIAEIGSNAPGEIASLSTQVQPHLSLITNVGNAHTAFLGDLESVAKEKISIAYATRDALWIQDTLSQTYPHLMQNFSHIVNLFGETGQVFWKSVTDYDANHVFVTVQIHDQCIGPQLIPKMLWTSNGIKGNGLGILSLMNAVGADMKTAFHDMASLDFLKGRGAISILYTSNQDPFFLFDHSYNANPHSMKAGFFRAIQTAKAFGGRVFSLLGSMGELKNSLIHHRQLGTLLAQESCVQGVWVCGVENHVQILSENLRHDQNHEYFKTSADLIQSFVQEYEKNHFLKKNDVIWIQGSLKQQMNICVDALKTLFG